MLSAIKFAALASMAMANLAAAINAIDTYPACDSAQAELYGINGHSKEPIVFWHHPDGLSSVYDTRDIVCTFHTNSSKFAVHNFERRSFSPLMTSSRVMKRDCADCDKACFEDGCQSGAECYAAGCTQGCSTWYACTPEECEGLTTACI